MSEWFCTTSIGFNSIFYGTKNPRRFKICVFTCIYCWMAILGQLIFISSGEIYSKFDGPFVPEGFRTVHTLAIITFALANFVKTEFLFQEIKCNLKPLRVFYCLINNWKFSMIKHNLNAKNYKRFSYLTRVSEMFLVDNGASITIILGILIIVKILFSSRQLFWLLEIIHLIPLYLWGIYDITIIVIIIYAYFLYYKLIFD